MDILNKFFLHKFGKSFFVVFMTTWAFSVQANENCLPDVVSALKSLPTKGQKIEIAIGDIITGRNYTQSPLNFFGVDNHFQGIKVFGNQYFAISGSDIHRKKADLYWGKIEGKKATLLKHDKVPGGPDLWHGGGMGLWQDVLYVPTEDYRKRRSNIYLYDVSNPQNPKKLEHFITRNFLDAGAVDLNLIGSDQALFVFTPRTIEIYVSLNKDHQYAPLPDYRLRHNIFKGSNVETLRQCDGKVFLLEFYNEGAFPPMVAGVDRIQLYSINLNQSDQIVSLVKMGRFEFACESYCDFSASAGVRIHNGKLELYGTNHFRDGNVIRMKQFLGP
jgi:hypothetical protein